MKQYALAALASLLAAAVPAEATVFTFTQGGYADGATAFGSFVGTDLDANGQISSFAGEVSDFSVTFSGGTEVGPFSLGFGDLFGLVYSLDGILGDDTIGDIEGVLAENFDNGFAVGPGPFVLCDGVAECGVVSDFTFSDFTTEGLTVTAGIPEPASWALMIGGFGMIGAALRRRPGIAAA